MPAPGEPIQPIPVDTSLNPDKVALGAILFNDVRLSEANNLSCASCHKLASGGDDDLAKGISLDGSKHVVNTPTVFNARFNFRQNWDGSASSLEEQVDHALHSGSEAGSNWNQLLATLHRDAALARKFNTIYPEGITRENFLDALTEFEKSLVTPNSRFDQYLLGDSQAITDDEKQGYQLFKELGCIACHQGINIGGNLFQKFGIFYDYLSERGDVSRVDLGRVNVTDREIDKFVFKVPGLRNVEVTAPYLHDGTAETLEQAITIMGKTQIGTIISDQDIELLVKFLKTLTGQYDGKPLASHRTRADNSTQLQKSKNNENRSAYLQIDREKS